MRAGFSRRELLSYAEGNIYHYFYDDACIPAGRRLLILTKHQSFLNWNMPLCMFIYISEDKYSPGHWPDTEFEVSCRLSSPPLTLQKKKFFGGKNNESSDLRLYPGISP